MTNDELKEALLNRRPVVADIPLLGKIEYSYVLHIIYGKDENNGIKVSAELVDENCINSTIKVDPKIVSYKD